MKRLAAILFLSIFLFNLYGYQLLINYWQTREDVALTNRMYADVNPDELVSIKVPTTMPPYTENSGEFEWTNGEVTIEGTAYKYVKRRFLNDSIEFLCLPHTAKAKLENVREHFFRLCNDVQNTPDNDNPEAKNIKPFLSEYYSQPHTISFTVAVDNLKQFFLIHTPARPKRTYCVIDHPPEYALS